MTSPTAEQRHLAAAQAYFLLRLRRLPRVGVGPGEPAVTDESVHRAAAELAEASAVDPPPRLVALARRLGLSQFEQHLLSLAACAALDPEVAALCAPGPSFALAAALLDDPAWDAVSPARPLRRHRLLELGPGPLAAAPLRVDERVLHALQGVDYLDERLAPATLPLDELGVTAPLPPSQLDAVRLLIRALDAPTQPVVHVSGPDPGSNRLVVARAAAALGLDLVRLAADALPQPAAELDAVLRIWSRETLLAPLLLYVDAADVPASVLQRLADRLRGALVLDLQAPLPDLGCPVEQVDIARPTTAEQRDVWRHLAGAGDLDAARLSAQFDLGVAAIESVARGSEPALAPLWDACLRHARPRLDALAHRIDARPDWSELVLPPDDEATLRQLVDQARLRARVYDDWGFRRKLARGLGITALFAGESGTGKTLAAEVLAAALDLPLYRVDLSSVVSKYIGETEKNLRRLFDAADGGGAVLFFDEADALFGKRSEVKDSHDRYANIEVGYLLQRMEAYRGLTVLATNFKGALDGAFLRRIRFVVNFPFPGPAERAAIWRRAFPREAELDGLDWAALAEISLTGGSIANIAVNAAFLAAAAGGPVTMDLVLRAVRTELRKLDRPAHEADLARRAP
jgi:hypothetical protein